jgi:hypothetical protein
MPSRAWLYAPLRERGEAIGALAWRLEVAATETLGVAEDGSLMDLAAKSPEAFRDVAHGKDDLAALLYTESLEERDAYAWQLGFQRRDA